MKKMLFIAYSINNGGKLSSYVNLSRFFPKPIIFLNVVLKPLEYKIPFYLQIHRKTVLRSRFFFVSLYKDIVGVTVKPILVESVIQYLLR